MKEIIVVIFIALNFGFAFYKLFDRDDFKDGYIIKIKMSNIFGWLLSLILSLTYYFDK